MTAMPGDNPYIMSSMIEVTPPLVSIMMPVFNAERFIASAVDSIVSQTFTDWELIIINDGSTDGTSKVLDQYKDDRIRVLQQPNSGEAVARNHALQLVRGKYLAFLDADDQWLPEFLQELTTEVRSRPDVEGVYCDGYHIDVQDKVLSHLSDNRRGPFEGYLLEALVRASDVFGPPICVLLDAQAVKRTGIQFDPRIVIGPDWDFFTRLSPFIRFTYLDKKLVRYRVHTTNITLTAGNEKRRQSLALCREKAIKMAEFGTLTLDTRYYTFYDLLVNLSGMNAVKQEEVTGWHQFQALPGNFQAALIRQMAIQRLLGLGNDNHVKKWLQMAWKMDPSSLKTLSLMVIHWLNPRMAASMLRRRQRLTQPDLKTSPFSLPKF